MEKEKLTDVPLHQIQIKDAFWDKYIRLVKDVMTVDDIRTEIKIRQCL